jgi:hypothetical protein
MTSGAPEDPRYWRQLAGNQLMYDTIGATQFGVLTMFFGLRETHKLLEIGAGSLRASRLLIPYLNEHNYCGIEPNESAVQLGLDHELGNEMLDWKKPRFAARTDFGFYEFGETFDYALAYSLLTHVPPGDILVIFDNLAKCFHEQSIFLATASLRDEELIADHEKWTGLPINHYSLARIQGAAGAAGMLVARLGKIHQDWFVAYREGNDRAEAGIAQMNSIDWNGVTPRWEQPPNWPSST